MKCHIDERHIFIVVQYVAVLFVIKLSAVRLNVFVVRVVAPIADDEECNMRVIYLKVEQ
jgi:hypothetical protein